MTRRERPNVLVFFTDQQRWDTAGVHGNPLDLTPNFDRMAHSGTHAYYSSTCQPVCGPARATLQTGLYGTTTGCFRNGIPLPGGSSINVGLPSTMFSIAGFGISILAIISALLQLVQSRMMLPQASGDDDPMKTRT